MQKFNIVITKATGAQETVQAKSEANMWNILRAARNQLTEADVKAGVRAVVTAEDGTPFKDITFKMNAKGKIEMPNAVKETCRAHRSAAKKAKKEPEGVGPGTDVPEGNDTDAKTAFAEREAELN